MRRIGIDENGLGAQLGPLIVTAVAAEVTPQGERLLRRGVPAAMRADIDDSKNLVSCHNITLGEAWARAIVGASASPPPSTPRTLLSHLLLSPEAAHRRICPTQSEPQCWQHRGEAFEADAAVLSRLSNHLQLLRAKGVTILSARCEIVCSSKLSQLRRAGVHRFKADLSAMERLILSFESAEEPFVATCGKVGGIAKYDDFFTELAGRLHSTLREGRQESAYHFPALGQVRFVRDADSADPLVMLASLVGKYVRELFMSRIARFYPDDEQQKSPSGYHDPVTAAFIQRTKSARRRLHIHEECFVRSRTELKKPPTRRSGKNQSAGMP